MLSFIILVLSIAVIISFSVVYYVGKRKKHHSSEILDNEWTTKK